MSGTVAVPVNGLAEANPGTTGQPRCPSCREGFLHPFKVSIHLGGAGEKYGASDIEGWSAVCVGNHDDLVLRYKAIADAGMEVPALVESRPCGFSMSMAPVRTESELAAAM